MAAEITGAEVAARVAGRAYEVARSRGGRPRCLVAVARAERGLSRCLVEQLAFALPAIEFVLHDRPGPFDAIWCCGFERDTPARVRALREAHREALLLVSGPGARGWQRAARRAGADLTPPWTTSLDRLQEALRRRRSAQPLA